MGQQVNPPAVESPECKVYSYNKGVLF